MATIAEQSTELRMATFRLARRMRAQKADDAMSDGQFAVLGALYRARPAHPHASSPSASACRRRR